jgi:hypothetical protein
MQVKVELTIRVPVLVQVRPMQGQTGLAYARHPHDERKRQARRHRGSVQAIKRLISIHEGCWWRWKLAGLWHGSTGTVEVDSACHVPGLDHFASDTRHLGPGTATRCLGH